MAEWLLVILAIVGIVLLGFFFSALDFFKGLTRFLIFGLFVFLLFLLANRLLPAIDSGQPYGRNYPSGEGFERPRLDPDSDISRSLRNFGEEIDEFVFGSSGSSDLPDSSDSSSDSVTSPRTTSRSRDFVYTIPGYEQDPGTIAEQPAARSASQNALSQPSGTQSARRSANTPATQPTGRRPVLGLW